MSSEKEEKSRFNLKADFLYGLIFILPIIATIWLVIFSIGLISGPVSIIFGHNIPPFFGFLITIAFITLLGLLARNIIGRALLKYFEDLMARIPIINIIYKAIKQVVNAFSFQERLMSAVMIEYPRKGIKALGFITKESVSGLYDKEGNDQVEGMCAVFVPTTPNPTSGYFLYLKKEEVVKLDISIEESVKILMSAGVLTPAPRSRK